jgi:hypothetical protein
MYRFLECTANQYMTRAVITVTRQVTFWLFEFEGKEAAIGTLCRAKGAGVRVAWAPSIGTRIPELGPANLPIASLGGYYRMA